MKPKTGADVRALLQNRATEPPRAEVPVVAIDGATATIRLYDPIDSWGEWWGMSAKEFAAAIDALPSNVDTIELLINCPGGEAFDGVAMLNVLRAHRARVVAVVQGIAASAAAFIACSADQTIMAPSSTLMIHNAWGVAIGDRNEMIDYAAMLEKLDGAQVEIFAAKSGKSADEIRQWMDDETFFTAAEAVEVGLADEIASTSDATDPAPTALARLAPVDLEAFAAELDRLGITTPSAGEREVTTTEAPPSSVDPEQASRLLATLTLNKETTHE